MELSTCVCQKWRKEREYFVLFSQLLIVLLFLNNCLLTIHYVHAMWGTLILAEKLSQQLYQQWRLSQITWRNGEFILIYY